jgi:hypothetical protein
MTPEPLDRQALLNAVAQLRVTGAARVQLDYDGVEDSGNIDGPYLADADGVELETEIPADLASTIDEAAWTLLRQHFAGWELNGGSYGSIQLHLEEGRIEIDHHWRSETYDGIEIDLSAAADGPTSA